MLVSLKTISYGKIASQKCKAIFRHTSQAKFFLSALPLIALNMFSLPPNRVLGEPKVLKERFDAIFASTRYSKALEEIKKKRWIHRALHLRDLRRAMRSTLACALKKTRRPFTRVSIPE